MIEGEPLRLNQEDSPSFRELLAAGACPRAAALGTTC